MAAATTQLIDGYLNKLNGPSAADGSIRLTTRAATHEDLLCYGFQDRTLEDIARSVRIRARRASRVRHPCSLYM